MQSQHPQFFQLHLRLCPASPRTPSLRPFPPVSLFPRRSPTERTALHKPPDQACRGRSRRQGQRAGTISGLHSSQHGTPPGGRHVSTLLRQRLPRLRSISSFPASHHRSLRFRPIPKVRHRARRSQRVLCPMSPAGAVEEERGSMCRRCCVAPVAEHWRLKLRIQREGRQTLQPRLACLKRSQQRRTSPRSGPRRDGDGGAAVGRQGATCRSEGRRRKWNST
mmetsp:Transcript_28640/g.58642  ORF Transcript_28640/g.58642 Transcript_28640/m.58642 type:complete len:222 (-) Transcript_28640:28-693(-)